MQTTKTDKHTKTADPRTPMAIALDEHTAWLMPRVPDRIPAGWDPLESDQSKISNLSREYIERLNERYKNQDAWRVAWPKIKELPAACRDDRLDGARLHELRNLIERTIDLIENPPPPAPPPVWIVELARDVDVRELPIDAIEARALVLTRLRSQWSGDRRAAPLFERFVDALAHDEWSLIGARRARRLLVGFGLPPVRRDDACYGRDDVAKLWSELPEPKSYGDGDHRIKIESVLEPAAALLGIKLAGPDDCPRRTVDLDAEKLRLQQLCDRRKLVDVGERVPAEHLDQNSNHVPDVLERAGRAWQSAQANEARYAELVEAARAKQMAELSAIASHIHRHWNELRLSVLRHLRALLLELASERGTLKWFYVREAYLAAFDDMANHPTDLKPANTTPGEYLAIALERARSLGVDISMRGAA